MSGNIPTDPPEKPLELYLSPDGKDRRYRGWRPVEIVPGRTHLVAQRKMGIGAICGTPWGENVTRDEDKVSCVTCMEIIMRYAQRPGRLAMLAPSPEKFVEARDRFMFKHAMPKKAVVAALKRTGNYKGN